MDAETLGAARAYTKESLAGVGALKGSPCEIESIVHENGQNAVTFIWEASDGTTRESMMTVKDGGTADDWEAGRSYKVKDLCIYASCMYRCREANHDQEFDAAKWEPIGGGSTDAQPLTIEQLNDLLSLI